MTAWLWVPALPPPALMTVTVLLGALDRQVAVEKRPERAGGLSAVPAPTSTFRRAERTDVPPRVA